MKRFLSIVAVLFSLGLNAQVSDFTATDYFGNVIHLYEILDGGQYVLLHFNTRTNSATPTVTPPLVEAYERLGCNKHDVFFIGVVPNGTTNLTKKYVEEYGIEFPMIHNTDESNGMEGPAMDIWQSFQCEMPTTMLIDPDKNIALYDIDPMKTAGNIITALADFGIEKHSCDEEPEPDACAETFENSFKIYPNPATSVLNIKSDITGEACVNIYDMAGRCVKNVRISDMSNAVIDINDIEKGVYVVNVNGMMQKLVVE